MALRRRYAEQSLHPGATIGSYRLQRLIGRGGMGTVYLAVDLQLNRIVALKILSPELGIDPAFRERFRREAIAQAALDHPHVVPVFGTGEDRGHSFLAMRYVDGETLKDVLADGPPQLEIVVALLAQVADALDTAHGAGIVHRDVKPQNILIEGGAAFLTDFGLTKIRGAGDLTNTGHQLGTIDYMSPEQFQNEPATARTDIYSFAAVLYECLTGHVPFQRSSDVAVMYAHLEDPIPSLSPDLPEGLDVLVRTAMSKNPAGRPGSANALIREVAEILGIAVDPIRRPARSAPAVAMLAPQPTTRRTWRSRRRIVGAVVLVAAGGSAGVAASAIRGDHGEATPAPAPVSRRIAVGAADFDVPTNWRVRRVGKLTTGFFLSAGDELSVRFAPDARLDIANVAVARRAGITVGAHRGELYETHGRAKLVYVFPLEANDLVVTCRTTRRQRATCAQIVGTMRINAAGLHKLPRVAYLDQINRVLGRLTRDRRGLRRLLRNASTHVAQASVAGKLQARFAAAAAAVARVRERDVPPDAAAKLASSLRSVAGAYGLLATAARIGDRYGYATSAARVARVEGSATRTSAQLRVIVTR